MKALLILTDIRSGSTWVGKLMSGTGKLGNAEEYLRIDRQRNVRDPEQVFESIMKEARTENGVFAVKIFPYDLRAFHNHFGYDFIDRCCADHDVSILILERRDRLGQAISAVRASQTNRWSATDPASVIPGSPEPQEHYDFRAIMREINRISESMAYWRTYVAVRNLPFGFEFYEDILDDSAAFLRRVGNRLGIELPSDLPTATTMRIQRDGTTEQWRTRCLSDFESVRKTGVLWRLHLVKRTLRNLKAIALKKPVETIPLLDFLPVNSRRKP